MLNKNQISVIRKYNHDYCLAFSGNGYISIDPLNAFLNYLSDFYFSMAFKITSFPASGVNFLMNSCLDKTNNKIGIAIDRNKLYVQLDRGGIDKSELWISFSDVTEWHIISVICNRGSITSQLDQTQLASNPLPSLALPSTIGFRLASDTNNAQNLNGMINNTSLTNLSSPLALYLLNEGSGSIASDSVGVNHGSIINGTWSFL